MIRIFIGYDPAEPVAYHVLAHSIITRSSVPVSITPVGNTVLNHHLWQRPRGDHDSTEFSNARFLVPKLCGFSGEAIFMDCDMLCLGNIADLWKQRVYGLYPELGDEKPVMVRKHEQKVREGDRKFLGARQAAYARKNWSSLMIINCEHRYWKEIDPNNDEGLDLHQFAGLDDDEIGEIGGDWNELLDPAVHSKAPARLPHFTLGGPWHGWTNYFEADTWCFELNDMLAGKNPCASLRVTMDQAGVYIGGAYHVTREDEKVQAEAGLRPGDEAA